MRRALLACVLAIGGHAMADEVGYGLTIGAEVRGPMLAVAPVVNAPKGARLQYDLVTAKSGRSGTSRTRQGGNVVVGDSGSAPLSRVAVSVGEDESCEVTVKVYEDGRLVASRTFTHPR